MAGLVGPVLGGSAGWEALDGERVLLSMVLRNAVLLLWSGRSCGVIAEHV